MKSKCCKASIIPEKQYSFWNKQNYFCLHCEKYCEVIITSKKQRSREAIFNLLIATGILFLLVITDANNEVIIFFGILFAMLFLANALNWLFNSILFFFESKKLSKNEKKNK